VKSKKWLALFFMSLTGILIGLSQNIINLLYDERYSDAGWMMEILLLRVATSCMLIPNSIVMMAKGLPIFSTISAVLKAFFIFVALPLSFHHFGVKGMIIMIAISGLIDAPVLWYALIKHKLFSLSIELYSLFLLFCGYAFGWLISNFDSLDLFIMSNKLYKQLIQYL
jgi:O-antigen/teichoic acid export membrane protein